MDEAEENLLPPKFEHGEVGSGRFSKALFKRLLNGTLVGRSDFVGVHKSVCFKMEFNVPVWLSTGSFVGDGMIGIGSKKNEFINVK